MLEIVIILMEVIKNFVEVVINFVEVVIIFVEVVRRVARRSWGIIGMVVGMATVKDRTRGAAGSVGSIGGAVVVTTAVYTLFIYIGGRVCTVSRRINIMLGRVCMVGGRVSREDANAQTAGRRVGSAVGKVGSAVERVGSAVERVRIKAIKKGSTEVLPLDVLLI